MQIIESENLGAFCKHVNRRIKHRSVIPTIIDSTGVIVTTDENKANTLNTPDTRSRNRRQKPAPENWRRFLERLSYNLVPIFSGARFWSRIEHVLFRDRIRRPRDHNTDL